LQDITALAGDFLWAESAPGSDPGLCIVVPERVLMPGWLMSFAFMAKNVVLTKDEAYELAGALGIHLSEHGGTGDGVIGAMAGAGLRFSGNDGRFRGKLKFKSADNTLTVREICSRTIVEQVKSIKDGRVLDWEERVLLGEGPKAVLMNGLAVMLVESKPAPGDENVAVDGEIWLLFNKNVVNMSVAENNRNCFSLTDSEGRNIPIMVNLPDDQINPELKRQIFIQPLNPLSAAMTYTLTLSPQLQAKNGALLGVERKIVFSTESGAVAQVKEKEPALAAEAGGADHSAIQAESGNPPAVVMDSEQKGDAEETVNPSPDRPTAGVEDEQVAESLVETSYAEDATGEVLAAEDSRQEKVENQLMDSNNSASPSGMILGVVAIAVLGCGYLILRKKK
jgi:hypothetical protein